MNALLAPEHVGALAVTAFAACAAVAAPRRWPGRWTVHACRLLAIVLLAIEASWWVYVAAGGVPGSTPAGSLPLQLCDAAILVASLALWTRRQVLVEVTYFWGLAGSLQALLTPDLPQHFPSYPYLQYYLAHGGVVAAALLLTAGLGLHPRPFSAVRVAGITVVYAALVGTVDALTGANYMYLRARPPSPTLLDAMGPWPLYIGGAAGLAVVLLAALEAPFHLPRRRDLARRT
ncbi:MAG TPA: TIGR02206 family membrane protein [Candidatus Dormibacteraeota bacterium]|nr:TIGR02206 family membrane protein [Candidatus Dormibacteraeota bacterium]